MKRTIAECAAVGLSCFALCMTGAAAFGQAAAGILAKAAKSQGPEKWALLVGIDDYAEIGDLKYSVRDSEVLRERLVLAGFPAEHITLLHDRSKQSKFQPFKASIEQHLDALLASAGSEDLVVFAFSGHGVELQGKSYLCPIEAQLEAPEKTLIPLEQVYQRLQRCRARQKLLLVDACRNDPRPGGVRALDAATGSLSGFAHSLEQPPEGIVVLSSCRSGQVSAEDDTLGHGVFMHFLLKGLRGEADREGGNEDGTVSLFELYRYADSKTRSYVARTRGVLQTPVLRGEISADVNLARVISRSQEVQAAWAAICTNPEQLAQSSPVLQWFQRMFLRHLSQAEALMEQYSADQTDPERQRRRGQTRQAIERILTRPEAIVLANPSTITANFPETLLALQRAYAFGVRGDFDGAMAAANEAIRLEPQNHFAYLLRSMAFAGKNQGLMYLKALESARDNPTIALHILDQSDADSTYYTQVVTAFRQALREVSRDKPELVKELQPVIDDPRVLGSDPQKAQTTIQLAIDQLAKMRSKYIESALEDATRIGLGLPCYLTHGAELHDGNTTVAKVSGMMTIGDIKQVQGQWLWVEMVDGSETRKGWVQADQGHLISYFEQFQLILRRGF